MVLPELLLALVVLIIIGVPLFFFLRWAWRRHIDYRRALKEVNASSRLRQQNL